MTVLFNGDFSTKDLSQYQNYQTQTSTNGTIFNSPACDPLMVPPAYVASLHACQFAVPDVGERSEVISALTASEGTEWWVGWWTLLGPTVPLTPGRGFQTVGQFHQGPNPGTGRWMPSPPIATSIQSVDPPIWVVHNGDTETLYTQDTIGGPAVVLNRWTQMIYHFIFSYDPSVGSVDWWVNGVQYATGWHPRNGTLYSDGSVDAKIGYHRAAPQAAATVYVGGYRIGTTRADVDKPRPAQMLNVSGPTPPTSLIITEAV